MAQTGVMGKAMGTTEELTQELYDIEELASLTIDIHWEIEALQWVRQSHMDSVTVELYGKYKGVAPSFARKRLEGDRDYQRLVGQIEELKRIGMKQLDSLAFRTARLLVNIADHAVKNAPWFAASVRSILDRVN